MTGAEEIVVVADDGTPLSSAELACVLTDCFSDTLARLAESVARDVERAVTRLDAGSAT